MGPNRKRFDRVVEQVKHFNALESDEELKQLIATLTSKIQRDGYCSYKTLQKLSMVIVDKVMPLLEELELELEQLQEEIVFTNQLSMELRIARDKTVDNAIRASFCFHALSHLTELRAQLKEEK